MIKACFFDIDGTLLPGDTKQVPQDAQRALRLLHEKGIYLFISSGRPLKHMELMPDSLLSLPFDGFVLLNGQYCIDKEKHELRRHPISREALQALVPWLKAQSFPCSIHELDFGYDLNENPGMKEYLASINRLDQLPPVLNPVRALVHETFMICPYIDESMDAEFLKHAPGMKSARWTPQFADMIPADGGKDKGLETMGRHFRFTREEMLACGDAGNDLPMFRYAGHSVCLGNGTQPAKAEAEFITSDIHEGGIARALVHYGLLTEEEAGLH